MKKMNVRKVHSDLKYGYILVLALKIRVNMVNNGKIRVTEIFILAYFTQCVSALLGLHACK